MLLTPYYANKCFRTESLYPTQCGYRVVSLHNLSEILVLYIGNGAVYMHTYIILNVVYMVSV